MILRFFDNPTVLVISAIVMIMALIFHNMAQTWMAARYGDQTPRLSGFNKFEPQLHLEPFGVLFLFLLGFGWPRPIPVNSRNVRGRGREEAIIWYTGPAAYLLIAFLSFLLQRVFALTGSLDLTQAFGAAGSIAILHAVINIFPVFPLDGARAALAWGPPGLRRLIGQIAQYGVLGFIIIFFVLNMTGITNAIMSFFARLIHSILSLIPGL